MLQTGCHLANGILRSQRISQPFDCLLQVLVRPMTSIELLQTRRILRLGVTFSVLTTKRQAPGMLNQTTSFSREKEVVVCSTEST